MEHITSWAMEARGAAMLRANFLFTMPMLNFVSCEEASTRHGMKGKAERSSLCDRAVIVPPIDANEDFFLH